MKTKFTITSICIAVSSLFVYAQQSKRVLFIGNSYTSSNSLPSTLASLSSSGGNTLIHDQNTPGGYTLGQHISNTTTINKITGSTWDYVILQEQSTTPALSPNSFNSSAKYIAKEFIRQTDKCAKVMYYMTWGREDPINDCPGCGYTTYQDMQDDITEAYENTAYNSFGQIAPVGAAWKKVMNSGSSINLYTGDGSHPSVAGTYLAACTFYATIFGESPVGLSFHGSLSSTDAAFLQEKAFEAYQDYVSAGFISDDIVPYELDVVTSSQGQLAGVICSPEKSIESTLFLQFTGQDTTSVFDIVTSVKDLNSNETVFQDTTEIGGFYTCRDSNFVFTTVVPFTAFGDYQVNHYLYDPQERDTTNNSRSFNINNSGHIIDLTTPGNVYFESFEDPFSEDLSYWTIKDDAGLIDISEDTSGYELEEIPDGSRISYMWQVWDEDIHNNWLLTPCLQLDMSFNYEIRYYYANSPTFPDSTELAFMVGGADSDDELTHFIQDFGNVYTLSFQQGLHDFIPDSNSMYRFGWRTDYVNDVSILAIDSFSIRNVGVVSAIDIEEINAVNFLLYPNPASDMITISGLEKYQGNIIITNLLGQTFYSEVSEGQEDLSIETASWPAGQYLVVLKSSLVNAHYKFLVE